MWEGCVECVELDARRDPEDADSSEVRGAAEGGALTLEPFPRYWGPDATESDTVDSVKAKNTCAFEAADEGDVTVGPGTAWVASLAGTRGGD